MSLGCLFVTPVASPPVFRFAHGHSLARACRPHSGCPLLNPSLPTLHPHAQNARAHTRTGTRLVSSPLFGHLHSHTAHTAVMSRMATWSTFVALHSASSPRSATSPTLEISSSASPRAGAPGDRRAQGEGELGLRLAREHRYLPVGNSLVDVSVVPCFPGVP